MYKRQLLDSLNKRLDWLSEVSLQLELTGIRTLHARAEEQALVRGFRDSFDFATARAVAELRVLAELCLPYVKVGGQFLAMKSSRSDQELSLIHIFKTFIARGNVMDMAVGVIVGGAFKAIADSLVNDIINRCV